MKKNTTLLFATLYAASICTVIPSFAADKPSTSTGTLKLIDDNKDGKLSKEEYDNIKEDDFNEKHLDPTNPTKGLTEFLKKSDTAFERADKNKDKALDVSELESLEEDKK